MENLFINSNVTAPSFVLYIDIINAKTIDTIKSLLNQDYTMYYSIILVYNNNITFELTPPEIDEYNNLIDDSKFTIIDTKKVKPGNVT